MEEVNDFKWDVIGLAETKLKECFFEQMKYGHVLYNSGVGESSRRKEGVGFLINKNHKDKVLDFVGYSSRLAKITLAG